MEYTTVESETTRNFGPTFQTWICVSKNLTKQTQTNSFVEHCDHLIINHISSHRVVKGKGHHLIINVSEQESSKVLAQVLDCFLPVELN